MQSRRRALLAYLPDYIVQKENAWQTTSQYYRSRSRRGHCISDPERSRSKTVSSSVRWGKFQLLSSADWQAYVICCHDSSVHITGAVVPPEYISAIAHDNLDRSQFLILRRGQSYNLINPNERAFACEAILSLLRYLSHAWVGFLLFNCHCNIWILHNLVDL